MVKQIVVLVGLLLSSCRLGASDLVVPECTMFYFRGHYIGVVYDVCQLRERLHFVRGKWT